MTKGDVDQVHHPRVMCYSRRAESDGKLAHGAHDSPHRIVARSLLKKVRGAVTHALCAVLIVASAPR